jgi:hypothetical protein
MKIRGMAAKAALIAVMAGAGVAVTAAPAAALANDDNCSEVWAGIAEAQNGMAHADTQYEFWTWFHALQVWLGVASRYC